MNSRKINLKYWIFENYYYIIITFYLLSLGNLGLRTGVYSSIIMLFFIMWMLPHLNYYIRHIQLIDLLVSGYIVYNFLSILVVFFRGYPISIYLKEFSNSILPVCFYFSGRCLDKKSVDKFYRNSLYAIIFSMLVGIYLYLKQSESYLLYLKFHGYSNTRLSSFLGSIAIGSLAVTAVLISGKIIIESHLKKGKLLFFISLLSCILSMQRASWITCTCVLIVLHYFAFFKWHLLKIRYIVLEFSLFLLVLYIFRMPLINMFENWIMEHSADNMNMFSSRTGQWISAIKNSDNLLFGQGLGTLGHKAMDYGEMIIADGGLVKLFCENGVIGTALFIAILLLTLGNGLRFLRNYYMEIGIVLAMLLQSIGSNIIAFQVLTPIFWLSIGVLGNGTKRKGQKSHENYVHVPSSIS